MIAFNDQNIYVGQIKQLLNSFNLPRCRVFKPGQTRYEGENYIRDFNLYIFKNNTEKEVAHYFFGDKIFGITTTLPVSSNIYDSKTHEYLGEYLRFIRDYKNVDLMSMYNCFSNNSPRFIDMDDEVKNSLKNVGIVFDTTDNDYTIFSIPVKFKKEYTIAIDCSSKIEIMCCFFDSNRLIKSEVGLTLEKGSYQTFSGSRFNHPLVYNKLMNVVVNGEKLAKEKILRMFLKIPKSCESSIVVLEGNYIKNTEMYMDKEKNRQLLGNEFFEYAVKEDDVVVERRANYDYINKCQLLALNSRQKYLIADRLIEYLSEQAISSLDPIKENIARLEYTLMNTDRREVVINEGEEDEHIEKIKYLDHVEYLGLWDNRVKKAIYKYISDNKLNSKYYDTISYFDKDIEFTIGGLDRLPSDTWR